MSLHAAYLSEGPAAAELWSARLQALSLMTMATCRPDSLTHCALREHAQPSVQEMHAGLSVHQIPAQRKDLLFAWSACMALCKQGVVCNNMTAYSELRMLAAKFAGSVGRVSEQWPDYDSSWSARRHKI